jgi:CHAT domain-containing protein
MLESVISIRVSGAPDAYVAEVKLGTAAAQEVPFRLERDAGTVLEQAISSLESGQYQNDELKYLGAELWAAILPGDLTVQARAVIRAHKLTRLVLDVPAELETLPWEALWDDQLRYIACDPLVHVVHTLRDRFPAPRRAERAGRLAILVVIPQGAGLDSETEWANLKANVAKLGPAVSLQDLRGIVTADRLSNAISSQPWHIVHFIGHGRLEGESVEIRLNDEYGEERWHGADVIVPMFSGAEVDACFLNCCHGGTSNEIRTTERLAPALIDTGVRAVVSMRYAMSDRAANKFSQVFYEQLLQGARPGHLAYAAQLARKSLLQNVALDDHRSFITPLVYQNSNTDVLFDLAPPARPVVAPVAQNAANDTTIPRALLNAVKRRECILVIGAHLVSPPVQRRVGAPQGLRGLVEVLRQLAIADPRIDADPIDAFSDDWPLEAQLARVAERFEVAAAWPQMVGAIRDYHGPIQPSELHRLIGAWRSPGIFYTHFDGLMERALVSDLPVRIVRKLAESPEAVATSGAQPSLLVLVRGTLDEPSSLVLNEHDQFLLSEQIDRIHASITSLKKSHFDRRLLFIGCSPADQVVRELARKLLEANDLRATESYFVSESHLASDERFWRRFKVTFLRTETDSFVRSVSASLGSP